MTLSVFVLGLETKILSSRLLENKVKDGGGKEIGLLVNIIFDRRFFDARMLIFPDIRKWVGDLIDSFKDASKETIAELLSPLPKEIDDFVEKLSNRGVEEGSKKLEDYLRGGKPEEQLKKMYFLVSSKEIIKSEKEVVLKNPRQFYWRKCKLMRTFVENDLAFNDANSILGLSNLEPVNLGLVSVRGMAVKDPKGRWGRIMDLQIDVEEGSVSNLIIETTGKGASECLVDSRKIDFSSFNSEVAFEECPKCVQSAKK
jgi:sporulation protein YlmC with PRC-barrel domain